MHLSWLGTTAIKLQVKPADEDVIVVIDPYRPAHGTFPRSLTPHIALFTHGEADGITLSGNPFVLSTPGECETKGVLMTAVQGHDPDHIMVRIDAEGLSLAHLGLVTKAPTDAQLEVLGDVDILCLPVSNGPDYDVEDAVKVVNAIEPRVVIPMAYQSDNDPDAQPVERFLKEFGASQVTPEKKVILKKKDLPSEETKVLVLIKE